MTLASVDREYDVVVVGARCAGAATAMLLARRGLRVLAVDRSPYGSDTLSTLALMRAGVLQLRRWGVLGVLEAAGTPPVRTTSFHYGEEEVEIQIKPRDGVDALYAPRRTLLDARLVDAAADAGARVVHGVRLVDLLRSDDGRVTGVALEDGARRAVRVAAGTVIGADGTRSTVARLAGAETYRVGRHAAAVVYGYFGGLDGGGYHWHYGRGVSVGVIPTNDGLSLVFASMPPARFHDEIRGDLAAGHRRLLAECSPALADAMTGARRVETFHGYAGNPGFMRRPYGPGWALVGDAGYFKDPITAHGITDALRDAELLARAVATGDPRALAEYHATRDALAVGLFEVTDEIASFQWDLPTAKDLHLRLSREMNREVEALVRLHGDPAPTRRIA
jgi:2-polyprenyl-6-methoxyphenol hydroxylase-like FAD-dependent oxidoreductase